MLRWDLAERFHWTLPEVDALSLQDWHDLVQIDDGRAKYAKDEAQLRGKQ